MTRRLPDLGSASDWLKKKKTKTIRSTTQIWVVMRHQYGISALVSQTSFGGKTSGGVAKGRLFSRQANSLTRVLSYTSYIGMCRPIGQGFLRRFGLETGIHFAHYDLESVMVFEGTTGVYERIYRFSFKERKGNMQIRNGFEELFCFRSNLSNDDIIST